MPPLVGGFLFDRYAIIGQSATEYCHVIGGCPQGIGCSPYIQALLGVTLLPVQYRFRTAETFSQTLQRERGLRFVDQCELDRRTAAVAKRAVRTDEFRRSTARCSRIRRRIVWRGSNIQTKLFLEYRPFLRIWCWMWL